MNTCRSSLFIVVIVFAFLGCQLQKMASSVSQMQVADLRCEHRADPLGIGSAHPHLSWILRSDQRSQKQTAYQILVASSLDNLSKEHADLWDSGKVESDQTSAIAYDGKSLTSNTDCFWKVRVWDKNGKSTAWSKSAHWSMGLLKSSDWKAKWIGLDTPESTPSTPPVIQQANWIWSEANAAQGTDPGPRYFRRTFDIPSDWQIQIATCYITADDSFELFVNGKTVKNASDHTVIQQISITEQLQPGSNTLAVTASNVGSSTNPAGLLVAVIIESQSGQQMELVSDENWRAASQADANWQSAAFDASGWAAAKQLGTFGMSPWQETGMDQKRLPPARYLRRDFDLSKPKVKKARLYATALGIYQLFINGQRITDDYFSPGWTDYSKRVYYRTYDVTDLVQRGGNAIGAILADGWFAGYVGYAGERNHYGHQLRLLCQLDIEYEDGTTAVIASGADWKAAAGPILQADFLMGETYDARKEMPGWNEPDFNDVNWTPVAVGSDEVQPKVQAAVSQPVIVYETVKPVSVSEPAPGQYVFDMGQNFAGVVRLTIKGKAGQTITLRHGERLNPDGTLYTANLRRAKAIDTYICKGDGKETWQPYFTFHGFQYVELTGVDTKPRLDAIVGLALSSDTPTAGTFECSDAMVNKLQSNAVWTQRMNFIDVPTDCPQRDERLGWTGDAQVYINTACYQNDVQAFFTKWLIDLEDAQRPDGQFPMVAPVKVAGDDGGPAWADAGVICPWTIYKMYGDKQVLRTHYDAMKKFIDFCRDRSTKDMLPPEQFHCFGDWLNINDDTPKDVIYTAYFAYSTHLMAQIAEALGKTADSTEYTQLFETIKASFNKAYVGPDGKIKGDTQTAYVLALAFDLLDSDKQKLAADHLVRRIEECNWHLSTGFVGTKDLMLVLAKIGRNDVAYRLLHNDTFPSWGFTIKHGATTIWERWNGWTPETGFGDVGMNSFAHYSFGAVCQWMFENIGGIQTDSPAFKHIVLKPQPGGKLTWAKTTYDSIRGEIRTDWKIKGGLFKCDVTIPPNTTATLYLPAGVPDTVTESGRSLDETAGILKASAEPGLMVIELESGRYRFASRLPQ